MRVFILTDTALEYNLVEITRIVLNPDAIVVHLAKWQDLNYYLQHGNEFVPLEKFNLTLSVNYTQIENLLDYIYQEIAKLLPSNNIVNTRPHE